MENNKWRIIGNTESIADYFNELDYGKILYTLIFSSFKAVDQLLKLKGKNTNIMYGFASVDESNNPHILYSGIDIEEFNIAIEKNIIKVGNYITIQISNNPGYYVSTIIVTDAGEAISEDWLWLIDSDEKLILYQANF